MSLGLIRTISSACTSRMTSPAYLPRGLQQWMSTRVSALEMAAVIDPYCPKTHAGIIRGWSSFCSSTLAIVQLRQKVAGWTVPTFKDEVLSIYSGVGAALANADEEGLQVLTTRSCYESLLRSIRSRQRGETHTWKLLEASVNVKQVRIGHNASMPSRQFAQVTCLISSKLVWSIKRGRRKSGGVGTVDTPHSASDLWVLEKCITDPPKDAPTCWKLREKLNEE